MLYKTHIAGGIIAGLLVGFNPVGIIISGAASLLPDIDSPHSFAGRRIWPISALIQHTAGHRGCFHSLLAAVIIYFFSIILIPKYCYSPPDKRILFLRPSFSVRILIIGVVFKYFCSTRLLHLFFKVSLSFGFFQASPLLY
jgi:membrane-bound metal-dependent hydrolase YbcI (DUF457 family)